MGRSLGGGLSIVFAVFLMAVQDTAIKTMSGDMSLWQLFVVRSPIALLILTAVALLLPRFSSRIAWRDAFAPWALARSCCMLSMYIFMYLSFPYLKLAEMGAAFYTAPIFTALMSALFLKDRVGAQGWIAVFLGFIGVLVVSKPGTGLFTPAVILPVIAGFSASVAAIITRAKLQQSDTLGLAVSLNVILLVLGGVILLALMVADLSPDLVALAPFMLEDWSPMTGADWRLMPFLALLICGISILLPLSYQIAPTVLVAILEYVYLIFGGVLGFIFLNEVLDAISITGMIILVFAGALIVFRKQSAAASETLSPSLDTEANRR